eukprot:scaffold2296_cov101-Skeletonema_dohrnii-CCMP3373.AAC.1
MATVGIFSSSSIDLYHHVMQQYKHSSAKGLAKNEYTSKSKNLLFGKLKSPGVRGFASVLL